ncbi:unnamed protein product, partial [Brassica rapa]
SFEKRDLVRSRWYFLFGGGFGGIFEDRIVVFETKRPAGVKATKARDKKTMAEENALNEFQIMWAIKHSRTWQ